jgi:trimeric autotransporter adhesin
MPTTKKKKAASSTRATPSILDRLDQIRVVTWEWNKVAAARGLKLGERRMGVIAQELEKVFPDAVKMTEDGIKYIDGIALASLALLGVQELRRECSRLENLITKTKPARDPKSARPRRPPRRA